METSLRAADDRRPDLDWLRVLAILLLHLFHVGMMFNTWDWHLKSPVALPVLEPPMELLHLLRMPLLMVIAGMGTAFALRRRSLRAFARDRVQRLFVPLVFGMFVIVPPQIFIERLQRGAFHGSYLDFYASVFDFVPYPAGSFSWHHLWFVAYLLLYSLLALPLFAWLRSKRGAAFLVRADAWLARGWNVGLPALPLALGHYLLRGYPETHALIDDPRTLLGYGQLFVFGHLLARCPRVWEHLVARRRALLLATLAVFGTMVAPNEYPPPLETLGRYALVWGVVLCALTWARVYVTRRRPWLAHAQELAYPFYIFHQSVIVVVGYALLRVSVGPWSLAGLVLAASFVATWGLCELGARVRWLRPMLGMKPRSAAARASVGAERTGAGHTA